MRTPRSARLGDLIAAAFDEAARYSTDLDMISRLATCAVRHLTCQGRRISIPQPLAVRVERKAVLSGIGPRW